MIKKASLLTACSVTAFSAWAQDTTCPALLIELTACRTDDPTCGYGEKITESEVIKIITDKNMLK